jgi:hypothetical protein
MLEIAGGILIAVFVLLTLPFWLRACAWVIIGAVALSILGGLGYVVLDIARTAPEHLIYIVPIVAFVTWRCCHQERRG